MRRTKSLLTGRSVYQGKRQRKYRSRTGMDNQRCRTPQFLAQDFPTQIIRNPLRLLRRKGIRTVSFLMRSSSAKHDWIRTKNDDGVDAMHVTCALILYRCGPKSNGLRSWRQEPQDELQKSAVVKYWRKKRILWKFYHTPGQHFL